MTYVPALDGLRAVAIVLVLVTHAARPHVWPGGFGVDVFFVLSGFLITTLLWREHERADRIALGRFYARRAIRLYPALLAALAGTVVLGLALSVDVPRLATETLAALLYATPVTDALVGPSLFYGHLWTLGVEEYFYLVWPLVLIALLRLRLGWRAMAMALVAGAVALYAARTIASLALGTDIHLLRVAGIALGCALGLVLAHASVPGDARWWTFVGCSGLVGAWLTSGRGTLDLATPVIAAGAALALVVAIMSGRPTVVRRALETTPLVYLGRISYELYLWHVPFLLAAALLADAERNQVWWWAYPGAVAAAAATRHVLTPWQARWRRAVTVAPSGA